MGAINQRPGQLNQASPAAADLPPATAAGAAALRAALSERVIIADGAMGSMLQVSEATLDDFDGHEGCNEILNVTRPDIIRAIHDGYLDAGVDCISTNTFGANLGNLGEYGIADRIGELAEAGARIARQGPGEGAGPGRGRVVGPGPGPLGARLHRPGYQAAHARSRHLRRAPRHLRGKRRRAAAGRRRRADRGDLAGA